MLYYLLYQLHTTYSVFNVFRYITFRAAMAALMALAVSFLLGPWLIRTFTEKQIGQQIRDDGPASHSNKAGTPTMGGALIILALSLATLLLADIANSYVLVALIGTVGFGVVGFADDYLKLKNTGKLIKDFDLMIAAICKANDLVLITTDRKHFQQIPHLKVEVW